IHGANNLEASGSVRTHSGSVRTYPWGRLSRNQRFSSYSHRFSSYSITYADDLNGSGSVRTHTGSDRHPTSRKGAIQIVQFILVIGTERTQNRFSSYFKLVQIVFNRWFRISSLPVHFVLFHGSLCPRNIFGSIEFSSFFDP